MLHYVQAYINSIIDMIRTPTDLTAYLYALALQIPGVVQVITGEGSRQDESTTSKARYPQVLIETPEADLNLSQAQHMLSTRIFVIDRSQSDLQAHQDMATDRTYRIAEAIVGAIRAHILDDDIGLSLHGDSIEITPLISKGSDQLRGWTFEITITIDQRCSTFDTDTFYMPQFSVAVSGDPGHATLTITDTSIGTVERDMWYREEQDGVLLATVELNGTELILTPTDPVRDYRIIHLWMRMSRDGILLWTYARVHTRDRGGLSIPFIPHYPV